MSSVQLDIRTLSDRLVDVVRDFILSGTIAADVPIRQDALAAELRVSKIPLREALARLEQDGLVVSYANRGFFVRPMSPEEAEEIYALRIKLEPDAAAFACLKADDEDRERARLALEQFDIDAAAQKPTVGALNRAFHLALVRPGGQRVTTNIVARLHVLADRYVRKHLEPKGRFLRAEAEHHEMLDAWIKRRDARVRKLITQHLEHTLGDLRAALRPSSAAGNGKAATSSPSARKRAGARS
jgi:DNA-binding GntR family transcriptional regulator